MKFQEEYAKLNKEQKLAVDTIEGPVMVVAGPGTGKTQILTLRIANILNKTDIDADNILALTFTESGATSMKRRLINIIGNDAYRVNINTFHGFCNDIIQNYPESFSKIAGFSNIDEVKQIEILKNVLDNIELKELITVSDRYFYVKNIKHKIEELKKEGFSYLEFRKLAEQAKIDFENNSDNYNDKTGEIKVVPGRFYTVIKKNIELSYIFEKYQERLRSLKYYDYSDMIIEVLNAFQENRELLVTVQEQYQYLLIDEYQDTNASQNKIIELIAQYHDYPNIFIVGDPKQAIFRFQGASLYNFDYFKKLYPSAIVIDLINNYRSSQLILDSAHSLIKRDIQLKSCSKIENSKIKIFSLPDPKGEAYFVSKKISCLIDSGINANDIAVLYRNHKDSDELVEILEKMRIPFSIKKKINILNDEDVLKLLLILNTIYNYGNDEFLFKCMHIDFLNIDPLDIYKIISFCNQQKINGYDFFEKNVDIKLNSIEAIQKLMDNLKQWKKLSKNELFINFFDKLIKDINFYEYIQKSDNVVDKLDKLDGLFDQIKKITQMEDNFSLDSFIKYLDIIEENSIDINKDSILGDLSGVKLMTAHHAKGLEFDYVFIINANENKWEGKIVRDNLKLLPQVYNSSVEQEESEEINLFFVCLTRAKKEIYITYSENDSNGKNLIPSIFVNEIKEEFKELEAINNFEEFKKEHFSFISKPSKKYTIQDKELVKEIFTKNGLSVTAFNNYLECPWKYFYRNLFRLPSIQTKPLIKGDAIHLALRDFFVRHKEEGRPEKDFLINSFMFHLKKFPLSNNDFDQISAQGIEILSKYYDYYPVFHENTLTELSISGINLDSDIRITGKLDKIEIYNNNHVAVVDYKTGKSKSENEILGKTKNSDENYYNQLKFYGLLLKYYQNGKYIMDKAVLDFVEASDKKEPVKREFEIPNEAIDLLEKDVIKVGHEILNLEFWDKYCDDKDCEFCKLRKMMD